MPRLETSPLLYIISFLLFSITNATTDTFVYGGCSRIKYTPNSQYETNLNSLLTTLVNSAMYTPFSKFTIGAGADIVHGLFQCRGDLSNSDCSTCVQHALSRLGVLCSDSCGGALQLEGCFIKYDNATFLGVEDKTVVIKKCGQPLGYNSDALARRDQVLSNLASGSDLFRVGGLGGVQGVAQCTGDLSLNQCQDCLSEAIGRLKSDCGPAAWGDLFLAKCSVRYTTGESPSYATNESSQDKEIEKTLAILIGLIAGVALIIIFAAFLRKLCEGKEDGK